MHQQFAGCQFLTVSLLGASRCGLHSASDSTCRFSVSETNFLCFGQQYFGSEHCASVTCADLTIVGQTILSHFPIVKKKRRIGLLDDESLQLGEKRSSDDTSQTTLTASSSGGAALRELEESLKKSEIQLVKAQMELATQRKITAELERMAATSNSDTKEAVAVRIVTGVSVLCSQSFAADVRVSANVVLV